MIYVLLFVVHLMTVNSICWAPHEYGLMLLCGASDGAVSIVSLVDGNWEVEKIPNAHSCVSVFLLKFFLISFEVNKLLLLLNAFSTRRIHSHESNFLIGSSNKSNFFAAKKFDSSE